MAVNHQSYVNAISGLLQRKGDLPLKGSGHKPSPGITALGIED